LSEAVLMFHIFVSFKSNELTNICVYCSKYGGWCWSRSGRSGVSEDSWTTDQYVGEACPCLPGQNHAGYMFRLSCLIGRWISLAIQWQFSLHEPRHDNELLCWSSEPKCIFYYLLLMCHSDCW